MNNQKIQPGRPVRRPAAARKPDIRPRRFPARRPKTGAFFGFIFVMIAIYIGGYIYNSMMRPEISQTRVEMGSIALPTRFNGIILRDEVVYHADAAGALVFHAEDHERVRRGRVVATIQDAAAVEAHRRSLARVDQEAVDAQRQRTGIAINEEEIAQRNRGIATHVSAAAFGLSAGDVGGAFGLSYRVRDGLVSRNELYFSDEAAMREFNTVRAATLADMSGAIQQVTVANPGILAAAVDGLEDVATPTNMTNISREIIENNAPVSTFSDIEVAPGDGLFRIIRSNDWYIAAYLPRRYGENLAPNATVTIYAESGGQMVPLASQIYHLADAGNDIYVVFRTNRDMMRFIDRRHVSFQLTANPQEGFKIPQNAIVEGSFFPVPADFVFIEREVRVVNLVVGESIRTVPVSGSRSLDGSTFDIMAEGSELRVGDELAFDGEEPFRLAAIDTAIGVYVTNMGVTQFRRISLEDNFGENAEYVILNPDPRINPNIRIFDRIVADARGIGNRHLLN
ncbi:MAG: hypothetical protein FWC93_00935 [Defluviitaleaceae bacterium]|nr:hypothetical protein [Defluviitaleaceae bacterium]